MSSISDKSLKIKTIIYWNNYKKIKIKIKIIIYLRVIVRDLRLFNFSINLSASMSLINDNS